MIGFIGKSAWFLAAGAAVLVVAFLMGAPPQGFLLILLLACPLMMMFMMPGIHGRDDSHDAEKDPPKHGKYGRE